MQEARHIITISPTTSSVGLKTLTFSKVGEFEIGRDTLNIQEKRCSRKQLLIKLDDHSNYYIICQGMNPSYHKKYDKDIFVQMTKNEEYELEDGDQLSLLYEMFTVNVSIATNPKFIDTKKTTTTPSSSSTTTTSSSSTIRSSIPVSKNSILKRKDPDSTPPKDMDDTNASNNSNQSQSDSNIKKQKKSDADLPICQYGKECFRKNPQHFTEFSHPWKDDPNWSPSSPPSTTTNISSSPPSSQSSSTSAKTAITQQPTTTPPTTNNATSAKTTNSTVSSTSTTTTTTKPLYQKTKSTDIKNRQITFPFISTFVYNFDTQKAIQVAGPEIAEYLNAHKGEDDIRLIMTVDKSIYSTTLVNDFKKYVNDSRFEIQCYDITNDPQQFKTNTRFYATETTWRLKRTAQNKLLYDIAGVDDLEKKTKLKYPNPGKAGNIYPINIDNSNILNCEYGIEALFLLIGPNLNDKKPDCLPDYEEATPILVNTYRALFSLLDTYSG